MNNPLITIVMPCYNSARFVADAISSVLAQTSNNWKLIVIDDGSTDDTRQIIREVLQASPRACKTARISSDHKGLGAIRNEAIEYVNTEWVLPFDSDDILHPDAIAQFEKAIAANPDADLLVSWYHHFGAEDRVIERRWLGYEKLLRANHIPASSCYRKSSWEKAGRYRSGFIYEDWELWIRMLNPDSKVVEIPEVLIEYRVRPDSISHAMTPEAQVEERRKIRAMNREIYEKYGLM